MKNKVRQSNFELLRIIALFLVMILHSNFQTLGYPVFEDVPHNPVKYFSEFMVQGISAICVNVFIILSGWFGISPTVKGVMKLIYQVLFFMLGSYIVAIIIGRATINGQDILTCFLLNDFAWFVKAYLCLYIFAPILNKYADSAEKKEYRYLLIGFYCFQCVFGWATDAAPFIHYGFSTISFIGLYLVAKYIRRFRPTWSNLSKKLDISIFFSMNVLAAGFLVILSYIPQINPLYDTLIGHMYAYSSPFTIIECIFVFLFFSKLAFQSKVVNFIAASSFSVLFVHGNKYIFPYEEKVLFFYADSPYVIALLKVFCLSMIAFVIAIILDQLRIVTWKLLSSKL